MRLQLLPVQPGIARIAVPSPTLPPATTTNLWVLGEERLSLVDPGSPDPEAAEAILEALGPRVVERILLTHHHVDHASGTEALRRLSGAPVWASALTGELGEIRLDTILEDEQNFEVDGHLWRALHTPGHARGHLCFLHPESRAIVAGDMLASEGTILLGPPDGHLASYLRGLSRLRELQPNVLLPAHGAEIRTPNVALDQLIAHRHQRTQQIRSALSTQTAPVSAEQLVNQVYGELSPMVAFFAGLQICVHLEYLAELGVVSEEQGRWQVC